MIFCMATETQRLTEDLFMNMIRRILDDLRNPVTTRIGVTTTIGYGTLFYSFAVFAPIVSSDFDIGLDVFFSIFAVGLVIGGLFAPLIGAHVDRYGAKSIMSAGSIVAATALILLGFSPNIWVFSATVIIIELASAMILYEAAFAGLTQIYGQNARRHITAVTLIAGFASTIFWPLTQLLVSEFGWRTTCFIFASLHLIVCLPLNLNFAKGAKTLDPKDSETKDLSNETFLTGSHRQHTIWVYGISICLSGVVFAAVPVHMVIILQGQGISAATAALVAMIVGPSQVLARIIEMLAAERYSPLMAGRACLLMLPIALLVLILPLEGAVSAMIYAACYGISQGLANIIRGSVPLYLFGSSGYGALVGKITGVRFFLNAGAPMVFAFLYTRYSLETALMASFLLAFFAALTFLMIKEID